MIPWIFNKYTILGAVLLATAWFGWQRWHADDHQNLNLGVVSRQDVIQRVTIAGLVVPERTATLAAPYDGYIKQIFVSIGQTVKQGAPLISITQTPDGQLEDTFPLRSPFTGHIVQILKTEGANVAKDGDDKDLIRIDDTTKLYVVSNTPEMDYPKLKLKQQAVIKASSLPDKTYRGEIIELFQAAKNQERWERSRVEFPIRVVILDKDENMKPGMSVTMDIITAQAKDVLALRHDYVGRNGDQYYVIRPNDEQQPVTVGMRSEDAFEIVSGIKEGDQVKQVDFLAISKQTPNTGRGSQRRGR